MVEAMIASGILLMGVLSMTYPFTAAARNERADARGTLSVVLAQEMMEEVLCKRYADEEAGSVFGPDANDTARSLYDSYNDYNGYYEAAGNVRNFQGITCSDPLAANLSRSVAVSNVYVPGQDANLPCNFQLIRVTVWEGNVAIVSLPRLAYFVP
jgi:hypothetical protein